MADSPSPYHAIFVLLIVLSILSIPSLLPEDVEVPSFENLRPLLIISPIFLLLLVRFLASRGGRGLGIRTDPATIHRVSGSSIGLALILFLVVAMIWYQSDFQESWGFATHNES